MKIFIKEKVKIMVAVLFLIAAAIMHTEFVLANVNPASLPEIKNITVYDGEVRTVVKPGEIPLRMFLIRFRSR